MKSRTLKCKYCGKEFTTTKIAQKFCSEKCRYTLSQLKRCEKAGYEYKNNKRWNEQPCWDCKNACGGCSWSKNFTPVNGWVVEKVPFKSGLLDNSNDYTYKIFECPEFTKG